MDFGAALGVMREGETRVRRTSWNEGTVIGIRRRQDGSGAEDYFYASNAGGQITAWPVTHRDLFASDWVVAP